jgi:hypothetical protein
MKESKDNDLDPELMEYLKSFAGHGNMEQNLDGSVEKLIDCKHEIVFSIVANVLEENEKGETVKSKRICSKNYHIPVPEGVDYDMYMDSFFSFLENCLAESAKQADPEPENKPEAGENNE